MSFLPRVLISSVILFLLSSFPRVSWGHAVAALLVCGALCYAGARSNAAGPELVVALAALYFIPSSLITLPEGALFDVIKVSQVPIAMLRDLVVALVVAVVICGLSRRREGRQGRTGVEGSVTTVGGLLWRLGACTATFVLCYFLAGMVIFPLVKDYYAVREMPSLASIVAMQVLRSLALIAASYPLLRTIPSRTDGQLILALAITLISGLAPLIPPNDLMPPRVRLVHALEVTPYYALYGFLIATWFGARKKQNAGVSADAAR